jgi:hypothetical protein
VKLWDKATRRYVGDPLSRRVKTTHLGYSLWGVAVTGSMELGPLAPPGPGIHRARTGPGYRP